MAVLADIEARITKLQAAADGIREIMSLTGTTPRPLEDKRRILIEKVRQMANLPIGFSHGEGQPVTKIAILCAEKFIDLASRLELQADVFPNLDGGCAVAFYKDSEKVEVSISPEGDKADLIFERGIGFQFEDVIPPMENVGITEVMEQALKLRGIDKWRMHIEILTERKMALEEKTQIHD